MLNQVGHFISTDNYTSHDSSVNKVLQYKPFCLKGLGYIAQIYNWYGNCEASQRVIAQHMGTCRKTANKQIKILREDKVLNVVGRYFDTSLYGPGELLTDIKYRDKLKHVIPQLNGFPVFKLFQSAIGYTNILRDTNRETLGRARVATGYYPSATKRGYMDNYIAPYVAEIEDFGLSDVEKHLLSQRWSQTIVSRAIYFIKKNPKAIRNFAYLDGFCKRMAGIVSHNSQNPPKPKFRFDVDPDTSESYSVNLAEEAEEKATVDFHLARQHIESHASASSLYDAVKRKEFGLPVKDIDTAAQEVIAITKSDTTIADFISFCDEAPEWKSSKKLEKSINADDSWSLRKTICRDTKEIKQIASDILYKESDEYLFKVMPEEIMESHELWQFERSWTESQENTSIPCELQGEPDIDADDECDYSVNTHELFGDRK